MPRENFELPRADQETILKILGMIKNQTPVQILRGNGATQEGRVINMRPPLLEVEFDEPSKSGGKGRKVIPIEEFMRWQSS